MQFPGGALADRSNDTLPAAMMQIVRSTCLALTILGAHANIAYAAGANLAWNACLSEGGTANRTSPAPATRTRTCSRLLRPDRGPAPCTGIEATVEISAISDSLPSWWQLFNFGACRRTSLATSFDFSSDPGTACTDMWQGADGWAWLVSHLLDDSAGAERASEPGEHSLRRRRSHSPPMQLTAGVEYYAFKLMVNNARPPGPTSAAAVPLPSASCSRS